MALQTLVGRFDGVPTFFRACCSEASQGGNRSYADAGWHLASGLETLVPYDTDLREWSGVLGELVRLIQADDRAGVGEWFEDHFPRCMTFVPRTRREKFLDGVWLAAEECRI